MAKFNITLLANQGRIRLPSDPTLIARVLKFKYYQNVEFIRSGLGTNPSLIWKSIWSAKGLLESGVHEKVSTELNISIWNNGGCQVQLIVGRVKLGFNKFLGLIAKPEPSLARKIGLKFYPSPNSIQPGPY